MFAFMFLRYEEEKPGAHGSPFQSLDSTVTQEALPELRLGLTMCSNI